MGGRPAAKRSKSRGPGAGIRKTKARAQEMEHQKKKLKIKEGMLAASQERSTSFKQMVENQARSEAYKMAIMGYKTFKDDDPDLA